MSSVLHIEIVQRQHRFVWIFKKFICFTSAPNMYLNAFLFLVV